MSSGLIDGERRGAASTRRNWFARASSLQA